MGEFCAMPSYQSSFLIQEIRQILLPKISEHAENMLINLQSEQEIQNSNTIDFNKFSQTIADDLAEWAANFIEQKTHNSASKKAGW